MRANRGTRGPRLVYFMTIDKAKFRKPVIPGDVVEYHMTKLKNRLNMWWFRGEAKVAGALVAEAESRRCWCAIEIASSLGRGSSGGIMRQVEGIR